MSDVVDEKLARPVIHTSQRYYLALAATLIPMVMMLYAYWTQLVEGLGVTGLNSTIFWGVYMSSFIFFIGISHAGTLISAILRVTNAEWRKPITRLAEAITVFALMLAVPQVIIDMGRPDRFLHTIVFGRLQSPITWDVFCIATYLIASSVYLYAAMVPDFTLFLRYGKLPKWKAELYSLLSLNWRDSEEQRGRLQKVIKVLSASVIAIAVSVHTVVSWALAMSLRPSWHSTVFGPYFVTGAIYSGIGSIIMVMWLYRRIFQSEEYIRQEHFTYLGWLLLALCLGLIYMTINHILTDYYGGRTADIELFNSLLSGEWAPVFWSYITADILAPMSILLFVLLYKKRWIVNGVFTASIILNIGMYLERYQIVAPALSVPFLPYPHATYTPTWVEGSILLGSVSSFILLYLIFIKIFPPISVWEVQGLEVKIQQLSSLSESRFRRESHLASGIPIWILMAVMVVYLTLLYIMSRAVIFPVYSREGAIASSSTFNMAVTGIIALVVTCTWLILGYVAYQLHRISKA